MSACNTCRHWDVGRRDGYTGLAPCKRFPPIRDQAARDGWGYPKTLPYDWCGEFATPPQPSAAESETQPDDGEDDGDPRTPAYGVAP